MRTRIAFMALLSMLTMSGAQAQTVVVRNPTKVMVSSCPDHDLDTGHQVDILDSTGVVVATLDAGDPAAAADGSVTFTISVQPIKFGAYRFVVRAMAGSVRGDDSVASEVWDRAPGAPAKPIAGK